MRGFFVEFYIKIQRATDMMPSKGQFLALSDLCRETAVVVLGGLVIGNILAPNANLILTIGGFVVFLILAYFSIYFKKERE